MTAPSPSLLRRAARIAPYFAGSSAGVAAVIIGSVVGSATEPMVPILMKSLFDRGFETHALPLWIVPIAIVGLFATRGIAGFVAQYGLSWVANRGLLALRRAMFDRLLDAEPALFTRQTASALTNTLTYEVQSGANQLVYSLLSLLKDSLTLVALLAYLLWANWPLTLLIALLLPAVTFSMRRLSRRLHRLSVASRDAADELAYVVEENVLAWRVVRLHAAARSQAARFDRASQTLRRLSIKAVVAGASMTPLTQVITACAMSAVVVIALWQAGREGGTAGSFIAYITAMLMLVPPIKHLSEIAGPLTRSMVALERGVALIDEVAVEPGGGHDPGRAEGAFDLRGVTLRYGGPDQPPALEGVDLDLRAGESVALVGPSGAGKSTLVNLLPRFLEPSGGSIRLDGRPLADWDVRALRRQFALVSQDVVLFNDSLAANVALGGDTDRGRVEAALAAAHLLDFARTLPQGIDSGIGHNGSRLSGGQRQRLAIARAIHKDAPILILDEATSALDSESERLVQQALERLMRGRTSIVIAHRLSTIERADRIVALDAGRIVEQGSHTELLKLGGLYARLHAMQFRA